jgi:hypothetical protein
MVGGSQLAVGTSAFLPQAANSPFMVSFEPYYGESRTTTSMVKWIAPPLLEGEEQPFGVQNLV